MIKETASQPELGTTTTLARATPLGHALWEFDGEQWAVRKCFAKDGGVPGQPPQIAGRFAGQMRAMPCVAASCVAASCVATS